MSEIIEIFDKYKAEARRLKDHRPADLNAALIELENNMADASGLGEKNRLELRAYMQEFRRQAVDGYEAGAELPHLSDPDSGPRSGEYDTNNT
jgi:hypothetical protein